MRMRVTGAAVLGALSLSVLAVPAAQADQRVPDLTSRIPGAAKAMTFSASAAADDSYGDTKIKSVSVNGGKNVVVGISAKKSFTVTVTVTDPRGVYDAFPVLWHGSSFEQPDGILIPTTLDKEKVGKCTHSSTTTATCKVTVVADPALDLYSNALAGTWKVWVGAIGKDGDYVMKDAAKTTKVQRASKLTVNAAPEPVKKGQTITATGKLTRASWDDNQYHRFTGQSVKLQYRKKTSKTYTTVKTVKTDSAGNLKATVKASADGYFRYTYAGTATTPAVTSSVDYVDVK